MSSSDVGCVQTLLVDPEDEALAIRLNIPVLISADSASVIDELAARIHAARFGSMTGFARAAACTFPAESHTLVRHCASLLKLARDGTLFIPNVGELPLPSQHALFDALSQPGLPSDQRMPMRLITGTTTSLWQQVQRGGFLEPLFYRLNAIHLVVGDLPGNHA